MSVRSQYVCAFVVAAGMTWTGCREGAAPAQKDAAPAPATPVTEPAPAPAPVAAPATGTEDKAPDAPKQAVQVARPAPAPARPAPKQRPEPAPRTVTVAKGATLDTQLETPIATDKSQVGDAVRLTTTTPVFASGLLAVPVGSTVHGTVTAVRSAGRVKGSAELTVRFHEIELANGTRYPVTCEAMQAYQKGDGKETAAEIGGGAAVGGILGGVVGGKDDVWKGAAIGAAVGTGVAVATKGQQIRLPAGQSIRVQLAEPVQIRGLTR